MSRAKSWLRERLPDAPGSLMDEMIRSLADGDREIADDLAEGALRLYAATLGDSGEREGALRLLAADALLTHAFERSALDPDGIEPLALRLGARGRLGALAEEGEV
ncbi:MAG: hypothetical protein ACREKN_09890 [Longimicrobiaceae bacterium]